MDTERAKNPPTGLLKYLKYLTLRGVGVGIRGDPENREIATGADLISNVKT